MMKLVRFALRMTVLVALVFAQACGGDDEPATPACKTTICDAGQAKCIGNAIATCNTDGLSYSLSECGSDYCAAGKCETRDCPVVGSSTCKDTDTVNTCKAPGFFEETGCGDGECVAGTCQPVPCTDGEKVCGAGSVATCDGGTKWTETSCANAEMCQDGACVPRACTAGERKCDDDSTLATCKNDGTGWESTGCESGTLCNATYGSCEAELCEGSVVVGPDATAEPETSPDAGPEVEEDTGPPPVDNGPPAELEPLDKAECTIDGQKYVFTSNKSATYVETDKDLRITMDKGLVKVEISIKPIEEFDFGQFKSSEASEISVQVLYNDGSDIGGAQWKYQSVEYDVNLEEFQTKGGRVKGTFSGAFTPDGGVSTIPFTNGVFDVKRHD